MIISILMTTVFLLVPAKACKEDNLLAVEDTPEGVVLTIFPAGEKKQNSIASDQLQLKNHHLSKECGPNFERCQDLLVEYYFNSSDKSIHSILFIPLEGGLALVDVVRSDYSLDVTFIQHVILQTNGEPVEISCSPSTMFKIIDGFYAVCTNQTTNFVSLFEVYHNKTSLNSSQFSFPTNHLSVPYSLGNISNSTNFLHIEYLGNQYVIFALGTSFYSLRLFFYSEERLGDVLSTYCDAVHSIAPKEGVEFWAYCSDYVFRYDIGESDWRNWYTLAERGIMYQCSQETVYVSVFSDHANISRDGSEDTVKMQGSNFMSGVCFGNGSQDFFAYVDELAGAYVMDVQSTEMRAVYESECNDHCFLPIVVNNTYLIIRSIVESKVFVLDFFQDSPELLEAQDVTPVLVGMLSFPCATPKPPPATPKPPLGFGVKRSSKLVLGLAAGLSGGALILIVAVSVAVIAVGLWKWRKKTLPPPLPENKYKEGSSDLVMKPIDVYNRAKIAQETSANENEVTTSPSSKFKILQTSKQDFTMNQDFTEQPSEECSQGDNDHEETSLI